MQIDIATMEDGMEVFKKTRNEITIRSRNPTPSSGVNPEETKIETDTCTPLFTAALFTIARTWKQPRCPLTDEWIKKLWCIITMEYYSAIRNNEFESVLMQWMNLEPNIQSEVSQKKKEKYHVLAHIYGI